ncbi:MAG: hypothetical protein HC836_42470 [Richelia sp. RM2_1_2]|nr:hypothetical protein [Richelia sp. SM2_1_7]NJM21758.1 hypothetical protein [Richelia sp. SM1_7_0]NJN12346.1 hypothetical protein [Richelia sp. RM1_1_1]NJO30690.1 hypothetical protein [Richelia sp. SL_2_1]NJO64574.1 hypothetical protein [Richelia sp. RM2_1_2]
MDFTDIELLWMPEKRTGQDLVRLYLPTELKERFKLYCQLKGTSMTEVVKEQIEKLINSKDFSKLLEDRLKDSPKPDRDKGAA